MMKFIHRQISLPDIKATTNKETGRMYHTPAGDLPSITTVLGRLSRDGIMAWRKKVGEEEANRISGQASSRGTRLHKICEDYINNVEPVFKSPLDKEMFLSVQNTLDNMIEEVYGQEVPLYSEYLGIAGRVDLVCKWNGKSSIVDFKTSRKLKKRDWIDNYFMQCTAYCVMFEELTGTPVDRFVVLIAVDQESEPQIFLGKRDDYISPLVDAIRGFYDEKNLVHPNPAVFSRFH